MGNLHKILYESARNYVNCGWSVIPINTQPSTPKTPAIPAWAVYQQRPPTLDEIDDWFLKKQYQGLAVVCGRVSHLVVLDIDEPAIAEVFAKHFPELTQTFTVRSGIRQLPHYYYHVPDTLAVTTRRIRGAEWRYTGHYVVAPPTTINGGAWSVVNDAPPYTLTLRDLSAVMRFFDLLAITQHTPAENPVFTPSDAGVESALPSVDAAVLTPLKLRHYYKTHARTHGRNHALFGAAILARDCGWTVQHVGMTLIADHVHQPPPASHPPESPTDRQREAQRTIASAFSRPPRPPCPKPPAAPVLPNTIREKLLQGGIHTTAAARLIDALYAAGWQPGKAFSEREACQAVAQFKIGRRSVRNALSACLDEKPLWFPPDPPLQEQANAAKNPKPPDTIKCFDGTVPKRVKSGRPPKMYALPSPEALCHRLNLPARARDPLLPADFKNPKTYRQALYRGLVKRRPGQYTRHWLARRFNISRRSIIRYDAQAGVRAHAMFDRRLLTKEALDTLPATCAEALPHAFILSGGKRFPAIRPAAARLFARCGVILYQQRTANFYTLAAAQPPLAPPVFNLPPALARSIYQAPPAPPEATPEPAPAPPKPTPRRVTLPADPARPILRLIAQQTAHASPPSPEPSPAPRRPPPKGKALDDAEQEYFAQTLFETVYTLNPQRALTQNKTRQLVSQYGVRRVADILRALRYRRHIVNPAGFVVAVLRAESEADLAKSASG